MMEERGNGSSDSSANQLTNEDDDREQLERYLRNIGFFRLADDIREERFARKLVDLQTTINYFDVQRMIEDERQEQLDSRLIRMHSQLFDKASTYNNFVLSLGYAGFFAILSYTREQLVSWDVALIAVLLGSSILVFIFWTLAISLHNAKSARTFAKTISSEYESSEEKVDAMLAQETKSAESALKIQKWWALAFYWSSGTGFLAGIILLILLFANVIGINFTIHDFAINIAKLFQAH